MRPSRFGLEEIAALTAALQRNELWYWHDDSIVEESAKKAAAKFGAPFAVATSSGTASLHVAVAAARMPAGSEVVVTPVTDIGTINAILYQNLVPVFADVDPDTACPTLEHIKAACTERTRGVVVVHLTGCPVQVDEVALFCRERGLVLIEDCAQGLGATLNGQAIGTFGDFGCYSLNDQKHITCGEGGFVLMGTEERFYLCHNYADKYYDRHKKGDRLKALAPNYRMSELDGAMFGVQLHKLDAIFEKRRRLGDDLTARLTAIPGIIPQRQPATAKAAYFFFQLRIDPGAISISRDEFLKRLEAEGIPARPAYVPVPIYRSPYFLSKSFFPGAWPAELAAGRSYDYSTIRLPGAEEAVATGITLTLHEGFEPSDIDDYVEAISIVAKTGP
ncbi:DegT/DnrJ/EryC1/StrS family aminotransferase [Rhizobium leguminosarum]|nr:DegT/DnrJ/EryC1/StrS family aminotransferase [Rhizobium leguminosarum]